ncbi:hypothetical protein KAFR_0C05160 [Kazachstania africana CBS 2517]|uniref:Amino acid permease/ SLC12A domain-containing protein n=1 Tax=Kazachstania africana (strain ATCC 22294 / BCRC 22015 / CBS 2517 / CECT 1963 / NBRC 1671 / NRRL Y-8276) TaxID=1071382 RepID=H2AT07_KAZAF|nr:hypothetical protein KAFR_0C05160 [Kazachstania africana CBS 2517]CCF57507.1 hypothetical protein KAFR_0C05160 [Kazachstania africana CBS 2517]
MKSDMSESSDMATTNISVYDKNDKNNIKDGVSFEKPIIYSEVDIESGAKESSSRNLKHGLQSRHIQLIALGGTIGTGLFVGTSSTLANCGPAALVISYIVISTIVYPIMNMFGEMVCYLPGNDDDDESVGYCAYLVSKYVDESLGFATSWNYYYCFIVLVATECTAASSIVEYWTSKIPKAVLIFLFLGVIFLLNFLPVKFYGEAEFWFAIIKIFCITGLIIVAFVIFCGGAPNNEDNSFVGFHYWKNPSSFRDYVTNGSLGNFLDVYNALIKGAFAFILGPELVSLTSSECVDQRRNIAKASRRFVYRLMFFYIFGALSISVIVPYNDPTLLNALALNKPGAGSSPFVIGIQNAGITILPHIINFCILTSAMSAGNAFLFASTRALLTMGKNGSAPRIFSRINRHGVPYVALSLSIMIACLAFLNCSASSAKVFQWFSNISTISGFIGWFTGCIAYLRFRRTIDYNGLYDRLPFKTKGQVYLTWYSFVFVGILILTNGYMYIIPKFWNYQDFIAAYITLPVFLVLYFGHIIYSGRWRQRKWWKPVDEIDVVTGLEEIELKTKIADEERQGHSGRFAKCLDYIL